MPAIVKNADRRWKDHVPFTVDRTFAKGRNWVLGKVFEFNSKVGHNVFVPRESGEANYAEFKNGSDSPIGMQGNGMQALRCRENNLFHEMGHCVGLGHTYFHSKSRLPELFEGTDRDAYTESSATYQDQGFADVDSVMGYTPGVFGSSPRIARVWALRAAVGGTWPDDTKTAVQQLTLALAAPPPATNLERFNFSAPRPFNFLPLPYRISDIWRTLTLHGYEQLHQLDPVDLAQLAADIDRIDQYWKFKDPHFMEHLTRDDVEAIRIVVGKS